MTASTLPLPAAPHSLSDPFDAVDEQAGLDEANDVEDPEPEDGGDAHGEAVLADRGFAPTADEPQLCAWIDAVVDHDERALAALYDATLSRVYGIVMRVVRKASLAEEVVEETYFQVWRQAARFDPSRGRALAWLLGMARSRAIDAVRREARFAHDALEDDAASGSADESASSGDDLLDVARSHADLHRALMRLNAQPRQLVALAFFRGLSHEEIASQTELPLGTVKSQIRRALLTLRQVLGEAGLQALA